jgi:glycosyltransferase involved in cell wall biosynthesis
MKESNTPLVSVSILAYNQKDFIAQTIESVLAQKTDFPFEIIIGDDCSTDGTREVIEQYAVEYPDYIKPIFHPVNQPGIPGRINNMTNLTKAKGTYIAMLDGDDYWTDNSKLQKQVEVMKRHPDVTLCFHDAEVKYEGQSGRNHAFSENYDFLEPNRKYSLTDVLTKGWFVPSSSILFRNNALDKFPDWFTTVISADYFIHLLLAKNGSFIYLKDKMSVYRKLPTGFTQHFMSQAPYARHKLQEFDIIQKEFTALLEHPEKQQAHAKVIDSFGNALVFYLSALRKEGKYLKMADQTVKMVVLNPKIWPTFISNLGKVVKNKVVHKAA